MEPIKLSPAYKDYLWGGTKLKTEYGKQSDLDIVAESWELSTHKDGQSIVASGADKGKTLSAYIAEHGEDILGANAKKFDYFPILIKFIDAKDNLSIQVHPDDAYALKNEGEYGKTEMWYILEAEEGASLYYGFNRGITREEYQQKIEDNTILDVLNKVAVKKGDVFFIKSGTVHAIGKGIVICEIQQNSNTTYRVYDYDRRDAQGNPRQLHVAKALEVSTLGPADTENGSKPETNCGGYTDKVLSSCNYFTVHRLKIQSSAALRTDTTSFRSLIITEGNAVLTMGETILSVTKGDSIFLPAQDADYTIEGTCEVILSYV